MTRRSCGRSRRRAAIRTDRAALARQNFGGGWQATERSNGQGRTGSRVERRDRGAISPERLAVELRSSLARQDAILRSSLVLNPVENFPVAEDLAVVAGRAHGLYTSDKPRDRSERRVTDHQFAGRRAMERDQCRAYAAWADAVGAADSTLHLLSGLHAHIVLFMAMARAGQRVLLLPIEAGGHVSGRQMLERLGLTVAEMVPDDAAMAVHIERTLALYAPDPPDFVFV